MILVEFKCCKSSAMVCLETICCAMTVKRYGMVAVSVRKMKRTVNMDITNNEGEDSETDW